MLDRSPSRAFVGAQGTGKTFALQQAARVTLEASDAWRFVVLDLNGEWLHPEVWRGARDVRVARVSSEAAAAKKLAEGFRVVIVRIDLPVEAFEGDQPFAVVGNELARVAIEARNTILVLPEAHWVAREGKKLPPYVGLLAHQSRHKHAGVWLDTQRPADVRKELIKLCPQWFVFPVADSADYGRLREMQTGLDHAARALERLQRERGPGWHLRPFADRPDEHGRGFRAYKVERGRLSVLALT